MNLWYAHTTKLFVHIQNYFRHTPNVLCAYKIVQYTNIVLYTYTMVKHTRCFLYEPDHFVKIKGCVGVIRVLCMYTQYLNAYKSAQNVVYAYNIFVHIQIFLWKNRIYLSTLNLNQCTTEYSAYILCL